MKKRLLPLVLAMTMLLTSCSKLPAPLRSLAGSLKEGFEAGFDKGMGLFDDSTPSPDSGYNTPSNSAASNNAASSAPAPTEEPLPYARYTIERQDASAYYNGTLVMESYYDLVQLEGTAPGIGYINAFLGDMCDADWRDDWGRAEDNLEMTSYELESILEYNYPYTVTWSANVPYLDDRLVSVVLSNDWYMGGVYNYSDFGHTYDLTTGAPLTIGDLFPDMNTTYLRGLILGNAERYIASIDNWGTEASEIYGYTLDQLPFYISSSGEIVLAFETYSLGRAGAAGPLSIPTGVYVNGSGVHLPGSEGDDPFVLLCGRTWETAFHLPGTGNSVSTLCRVDMTAAGSATINVGYAYSEWSGVYMGSYTVQSTDPATRSAVLVFDLIEQYSGIPVTFTWRMGPVYSDYMEVRYVGGDEILSWAFPDFPTYSVGFGPVRMG